MMSGSITAKLLEMINQQVGGHIPLLHERSRRIRTTLSRIETPIEPAQPSRLEKKMNIRV